MGGFFHCDLLVYQRVNGTQTGFKVDLLDLVESTCKISGIF